MKYLFCSYTNPGLLYPMLGLALELRGRGHEVAFATGPAAATALGEAGMRRIPRGDPDGDSFKIGSWGRPLAAAVDVKHIEHAVRVFAPDVMVANLFALSTLIVRERTGIPVCLMGLASYLWPRRKDGAPVFPACDGHARWQARGTLFSLNDTRALFGMPPLEPGGDSYPVLLGDLFLLRSVAELEHHPETLPPQVRLVGACEWEPPAGSPDPWGELSAGAGADAGPVVYVQEGRTFDEPSFWPQLVEALGGERVRVFSSVGRMDTRVGELPANFTVRDHLPQSAVLPHADLVVSSGGSSVVLGSLTHGIPGLVIPGSGGERPDNAARLERAGCAVHIDSYELTPERLREAVAAALRNDELRRNAARLRDAFARVPGFGPAADAVEGLQAREELPLMAAQA